MCQAPVKALTYVDLFNQFQPYEIDNILVSILQIKKLRQRKAE